MVIQQKDNGKTACAAVLDNVIVKWGLPKETSIFNVEVYAIDLSLNLISGSKNKNFMIFKDSLSVLLYMRKKTKKQKNSLIN